MLDNYDIKVNARTNMDIISWQEIGVRLLFASGLGSATAICRRWYQTKQFIQSNTHIALGTAMFSIFSSLTSENKFSPQLVLGISIICVGISLQQQIYYQRININTVTRLWCAGAVGSLVGFGFFVPAYIGILIIIFTNLLFQTSEIDLIPNPNKESKALLTSKAQSVAEREIFYQCKVNCLAVDEAEVLALLVRLGKERNLTLTGIHSKNLTNNTLSEIEIQVDFVSSSNNTQLQLQKVLMILKSKFEVSSASWLNLSSELSSTNEEVIQET